MKTRTHLTSGKALFAATLAGFAVCAGALHAADALSVDDIVNKANEAAYYAGKDGRADVLMTISSKTGTRVRKFTVLRMDVDGKDQKFYVYFKEPADVRKMAYLVWKHAGDKDDDRWLWLPALNLGKRIAPGDKRTSFVGSDFVYEDISGRDLDDDTHELVETTATQYVIKNTPKDPDSVDFSSFTVWIDKDTFLPRKAEYHDRNGQLYRTVEGTKVETIDGIPTVVESIASDLKAETSTTNAFSNVQYNIGLKERIFGERFLRRPPREVR